jgi:hypothetical protein
MARPRTHKEIVDQIVYAVQAVAYHYGPKFNSDGLKEVRDYFLNNHKFWTDATWNVDVLEGGIDGNPDFYPKVINESNTNLNFEEILESETQRV